MASNQGNRPRRRGRRSDGPQGGDFGPGLAGRAGDGLAGGPSSKTSKDVVHHHPPKEMAADIGFPTRGGQTLLIAYFPWEASEADIEREFCRFCNVKRVHLVVDGSSRKPRCFGFVKFMSKADAEAALAATTRGQVQLLDTRGHVWHLKAEWTKSGDMVVDDSDAEQEVAKRKEERRSREGGRGGGPVGPGDLGKGGGKGGGKYRLSSPQGSLHPGVPAPLPPLPPRYSGVPAPLGVQGQMPQYQYGSPQPPQPQPTHPGQPQPPQGYGALQPGLSVYGAPHAPSYSGHQVPPPPLYGGGDQGAMPPQTGLGTLPSPDAPGLTSQPGGIHQALRDVGAPGYPSQQYGQHGYGMPPAQASYPQGFAPQSQPHGYVASQQGYGPGQQPFVASAQAYASQQYATQQQIYPPQQPGFSTAQAYSPPPQYSAQPQGPGYGAPPPGYGAPQAYTQQPAVGYPPAQHPSAYAASYGQGQGALQPGGYGYLPQDNAAAAAAASTVAAGGVMAYGSYPSGGAGAVATLAGEEDPRGAVAALPHGVAMPQGSPSAPSGGDLAHASPLPPGANLGGGIGVSAGAGQPALPAGEYLDMVWHMSELSMHEKKAAGASQSLPAPPAQQPPAPPAGHALPSQWLGDAPASQAVPGTVPAAAWNSFDDAAAKGMVDGLVGGDDAAVWATQG